MNFYSTRHQSPIADWETVLMQGLPADNGLYMPEQINSLPPDFWVRLPHLSFADLSFEVAHCLLQDALPDDDLRNIVADAINFDAPVRDVAPNMACLELFHGPSLAFKDFGARFMARMMRYFIEKNNKIDKRKAYILVATSGDTGGAVAQGFLNTPGIEVIILYPSKKVSLIQEQQLTALGNNVRAIEINGTFDDCQDLVKKAFLDDSLRPLLRLSSANSINLARLIPQAFYYVRAYQQMMERGKDIVFCVPSGNFGNLCAGLLAKKIGLPVKRFIAANNANNMFEEYLETGKPNPRPSIPTLSNAMDVGNPSNLVRLLDLYKNDADLIKQDIAAYSFSDEETLSAMKTVQAQYDYLLCPHTAVAYLGLQRYFEQYPNERAQTQGIFLATAHPVKFGDVVSANLGIEVTIPDNLAQLMKQPKIATFMQPNYENFKSYLLDL